MSDLLTTHEAADIMRVHEKTVRRMILRGDLVAYRAGRQYRILRADVLARVEVAPPTAAPRRGPVRQGKPGRFSQIAAEMDAA